MQIGIRQIPAETIEWLRTACSDGGQSRTSLACELCLREDWISRVGGPCLASARKLLPRLADNQGMRLLAAEAIGYDKHAGPAPDISGSFVECALGELGGLSLEPAAGTEERRRREAMIGTHHPQGWRRPPATTVQRDGWQRGQWGQRRRWGQWESNNEEENYPAKAQRITGIPRLSSAIDRVASDFHNGTMEAASLAQQSHCPATPRRPFSPISSDPAWPTIAVRSSSSGRWRTVSFGGAPTRH